MMLLSEAAHAVGGTFIGQDVRFDAVTTDSRQAGDGDLFVALKGERFDGHDFVAQCFARGVVAAMVQKQSAPGGDQTSCVALLVVQDTRRSLGDLAAHWRNKFSIPLVAITGSNGKTTVKEMLAEILRKAAGDSAVLSTVGNLNNDIGLPLTMLKLRDSHRYAVIEMGMNHPGEIAYLTHLAKPTVALVNNAQLAHLEGVGSLEAVARAKGEIFSGLTEDGVAIINADDGFSPLWREFAESHRVLTFGLDHAADVRADYVQEADGSSLLLRMPQGTIETSLAVPGVHNVKNALAASAAALAMSVPPEHIAAGLHAFCGVKGRLQKKAGCCGATIIDDTYNANPASMRAAIGVLARSPGQKIFVMGDMGELGADALQLHEEIGAEAKRAGINTFYAIGVLSAGAAKAFGREAQHFQSVEALGECLRNQLSADVTVLIKGSRFMRMEQVVEAVMEKEGVTCC